MLKTHAGENLILGAARRSIRCADTLILGNGAIVSRNTPDSEISKVAGMVLDLIVKPLRDIQINDHEFACLKAIVFFDPGKYKLRLHALGLSYFKALNSAFISCFHLNRFSRNIRSNSNKKNSLTNTN